MHSSLSIRTKCTTNAASSIDPFFHYALGKAIYLCEGVHECVHSLSSLRAESWGFPAEYQVSKEFSLKITTGNQTQAWCEAMAMSHGSDHFLSP